MRITRVAVVALLALLTAAAQAADVFIGDGGHAPPPSRRSLAPTVIASDGETFYVFTGNGMNRVRPDGTIVDAEAFSVPEMDTPYSAAYGRGIVVVTYGDRGDYYFNDGLAAAFTTAGQLLWYRQVAPSRSRPSVVYDGRDFVVVFADEDVNVVANVLDDEGFVTDRMILASQADGYVRGAPIAVRTDRGLLAVWRDHYDVLFAVPFDASGPLGEPVTIDSGYVSSFGGSARTFAVASNGSGALVVWANTKTPGVAPIMARHLDSLGAPLTHAFEVPLYSYASEPQVAWDGARYQLAWQAHDRKVGFESSIVSATVDVGAPFISSLETVTSGSFVVSPALAVARQRMVVGWTDYLRGGSRGKFANTGGAFASAPEQFLKTEPYDAFAPAAVWAGDHYVMAWLRSRGRDIVVVARRFDVRGVPLDPEPIVVSKAMSEWENSIQVASNGVETALVWTDQERVFAARMAANGSLIDAEPILLATDAKNDGAGVASDGRDFMIAWATGKDVRVRRLSARGGFLDESSTVIGDRLDKTISTARVAYGAPNYVVGFIADGDVWGAMLSGGEPALLIEDAGSGLAVASSGSTHLFITYSSYVLTNASLGNRRVFSDVRLGADSVTWTGSSFFSSGGSGSSWISPSGTLSTSSLPSNTFYTPRQTAVASPGDGTGLLLFSGYTRTLKSAVYARSVVPKRRTAGHAE